MAQFFTRGLIYMIKFTKREQEICNLVIKGLTNKQIAQNLFISVHTVKATLEHIYEKVGFSNRLLLALYLTKENK